MDCSSQALATAASCFDCQVPPGLHMIIQTYLLAQIANTLAGTSTDPSVLANAARCFDCASSNLAAIQVYLLCQIANASGA